jgi:hypothetical protein
MSMTVLPAERETPRSREMVSMYAERRKVRSKNKKCKEFVMLADFYHGHSRYCPKIP